MRVHSAVAVGVAAVLAAIGALHVYWATRDTPTGGAVPTRPDGAPLFRPGRASTLAVAVALTVAAAIVLVQGDVLRPVGPRTLYQVGAWAVAVVLLARAVGDFRYVGLFKRERGTRFARLDTRVYTPLCALLAAGVVYLAAA
jgi:hypothetical protein